MNELTSVDTIIKQAKKHGVDFGKGDPYNRLRYYTKIGWLPHMTRQADKKGNIKGHYPSWVLDQLILIEELKAQGLSNEDITKKIQRKTLTKTILNNLSSREIKNQVIKYATLVMLFIIFLSEVGVLNLGKSKALVVNTQATQTIAPNQIIASGTAFIPRYNKKVFVKGEQITKGSKVYITFNQNYSPASVYWISEIEENRGFTVELDAPVSNNAEFSWWISK